MKIYSIYQQNGLRNYNYLLVCEDSKKAVVVDPLKAEWLLALAKELEVTITHIINTHEHADHIAGNHEIKAATGAIIVAHQQSPIAHVDQYVAANDVINVGHTIELTVLDTPGHTFSHICVLAKTANPPALFCGDTLFNAGCGNCRDGDMQLLYETFSQQLHLLPDTTTVYPGHDYLENNLRFAQTVDPENKPIMEWLEVAASQKPENPVITTIAIEKQINPFFRLQEPSLISQLQKKFSHLSAMPSPQEVFFCLRTLRNSW